MKIARVTIALVVALPLVGGCDKKKTSKAHEAPTLVAPADPARPPAVPPADPAASDPAAATEPAAGEPAGAAAPLILTEAECLEVMQRSYALMKRYDPSKLSPEQRAEVEGYTAEVPPESMEACRRNEREWYDCKKAAREHFEAEDCNLIGADEDEMP